ncbi:hypothetical protein X975_18701, partial [Stegodyphus mimosarum]
MALHLSFDKEIERLRNILESISTDDESLSEEEEELIDEEYNSHSDTELDSELKNESNDENYVEYFMYGKWKYMPLKSPKGQFQFDNNATAIVKRLIEPLYNSG